MATNKSIKTKLSRFSPGNSASYSVLELKTHLKVHVHLQVWTVTTPWQERDVVIGQWR